MTTSKKIIIGAMALAVVIISTLTLFCFFEPKLNQEQSAAAESTKPTPMESNLDTAANAFKEMRTAALSVTPEQLELSLPSERTIVYGVVMDWEMNGNIATTVSFQTGDASVYMSTGGAILGGGHLLEIVPEAKRFVHLAQTFLGESKKAGTTPLPSTDEVKFYLLTNNGIYVGEEQMRNLENGSSHWIGLFDQGNNVISKLRKSVESAAGE